VTLTPDTPPVALSRLTGGALFLDAQGHVLLVRPTYKQGWDIPGGYAVPGESPLSACVREVREELDLVPDISGQPLAIDWAPVDDEGDKTLFIFDGGMLSDQDLDRITFADGELAELRFVAPADLDDYTPARLARRIRTAVAAKKEGRTIYAEHGDEASGRPNIG
jgi:8-oxo-dGTP pyrophosphatase MutT (NUDIX family)